MARHTGAAGACGRHLLRSHLAELALKQRSDGGGHVLSRPGRGDVTT